LRLRARTLGFCPMLRQKTRQKYLEFRISNKEYRTAEVKPVQAAEAAELFDPQSDTGSAGSLLEIIG
jgi:hypothetical protein